MAYLPPQKEDLKAIKKLMAKWLNTQATATKASIILSKNPKIRGVKKVVKSGPALE